jgi:hypothetical protein
MEYVNILRRISKKLSDSSNTLLYCLAGAALALALLILCFLWLRPFFKKIQKWWLRDNKSYNLPPPPGILKMLSTLSTHPVIVTQPTTAKN